MTTGAHPTGASTTSRPGATVHVVVIGAGMSGLLAAHRLQQAGVSFVVLEKDADVGGTWFENTYPGCRVDNPNHNYSYSFAQRHDWPLHYSTQDVLLDYLRRCADEFGLRDHIRFGTEVESAIVVGRRPPVDGTRPAARIGALRPDRGRRRHQRGRAAQPPLVPSPSTGATRSPASSFHSARWDHDVDLRGKRVAVIGTGASAVQFVPEIAGDVGELLVFQRTPPWFGFTPEYHDPVPDGLRWLYAHVPYYSEFNRFWMFWKMGDGSLPGVRVDPDWEGDGASVNAMNDMMRMVLTNGIEGHFADRPDLLEHVVPRYPPGAKRLLRDNGVWPAALQRDTTSLITTPIRAITATGIVTDDGVEHEVDVIVYGTGFQASRFLTPMRVTGRGGVDLHEQWGGDARALPRHHGARLPQPVLPLRPEHQHRDQRQHRVLLGVRRPLHPRLPRAAPARGRRRARRTA